ncbi:cellulose biosynthesis protein BcsF [Kosakonia sp. H02]|nr:cellulose biosynthesis protein BcsF [Kosakonia sp. H02]
MMSISDIIQLIVLCALIFFPLGYLARHWQRPIRTAFRLTFTKPRFVKPTGVLRRDPLVKADRKHDK